MYRFYNANSKGNFVNDCVIRAISTAEDRQWSDVYKELSYLAMNKGIMLDDVNFVDALLDSKYKRTCYNRGTIGKFAKANPRGNYLVTTDGHITCVIDSVIIDTWDCSNKELHCAWEVK